MENILILDTETTNAFMENEKLNLDYSMFYDLGLIVGDLNGNIKLSKSFVNSDIFENDELMSSAYFKEKMPKYIEDIANGTRTLTDFTHIKNYIHYIIKKYNISKVYAYNIRFDMNALGQTTRYITKSKQRYFFPFTTKPHDIMKLGRELAKEIDYKNFCTDNGYTTKNGKPRITVEIVVRYLWDKDFIEDHTGYEDTCNEYKILCELSKRYPNVDTNLWHEK